MSRLGPTLLSLALVGVITLAAYTDEMLVGAAVLVVQVLVATSPGLVGDNGRRIPSPRFVPAVAAGVVATVLTLWPHLLTGADGTSTDVVGLTDTGMLAGTLPAVAVAVFVALIAQMLRADGRKDLVRSVSYAVSLSVCAALAVGWIGAEQSLGDRESVAVGAAGLAAGLLVWMLPIDRFACLGLASVAGSAGGVAVVLSVDSTLQVLFGVVVGAAVAVSAVIGQVVARIIGQGATHASAAWGFPGAMSVALAAPAVYLGGQLVTVSLR